MMYAVLTCSHRGQSGGRDPNRDTPLGHQSLYRRYRTNPSQGVMDIDRQDSWGTHLAGMTHLSAYIMAVEKCAYKT